MAPEPPKSTRFKDVLESRLWYRWNRWLDEPLFEMPVDFNVLPADVWEAVQATIMDRRAILEATVLGAFIGVILGAMLVITPGPWWWLPVLLVLVFRVALPIARNRIEISWGRKRLAEGPVSWEDTKLEYAGHTFEVPTLVMASAVLLITAGPLLLTLAVLGVVWPIDNVTWTYGLHASASLHAITIATSTVAHGLLLWLWAHTLLVQAFLLRLRNGPP